MLNYQRVYSSHYKFKTKAKLGSWSVRPGQIHIFRHLVVSKLHLRSMAVQPFQIVSLKHWVYHGLSVYHIDNTSHFIYLHVVFDSRKHIFKVKCFDDESHSLMTINLDNHNTLWLFNIAMENHIF